MGSVDGNARSNGRSFDGSNARSKTRTTIRATQGTARSSAAVTHAQCEKQHMCNVRRKTCQLKAVQATHGHSKLENVWSSSKHGQHIRCLLSHGRTTGLHVCDAHTPTRHARPPTTHRHFVSRNRVAHNRQRYEGAVANDRVCNSWWIHGRLRHANSFG
jgi:hypothetical protein